MTIEYVNKNKLLLATEEAAKTGGDVRDIYERMGGLVREIDETKRVKEAPKAKPKAKKKK